MTTHIAKCALEYWRASGPRTIDRLMTLVDHFAATNGDADDVDRHRQSARDDVKQWELKP